MKGGTIRVKKYIVTGLNMLDALELTDGTKIPPHMGGIPMYGFCGMRLWTDSIQYVARVGKDFFDLFDPWFSNNHIDPAGLHFVSDKTPYNVMIFDETQNIADSGYFFTGNWADSDFYRPHPEDLLPFMSEETKGLYLTSGPEPEKVWDHMFERRDKFGFKIMWEPNNQHTYANDGTPIQSLLDQIEMASFNVPRAAAFSAKPPSVSCLISCAGRNPSSSFCAAVHAAFTPSMTAGLGSSPPRRFPRAWRSST